MDPTIVFLYDVDLAIELTRRAAWWLAMLLYRVSVRLCRFAHPGPDPVWQVVSIRRVDGERAPSGQELN